MQIQLSIALASVALLMSLSISGCNDSAPPTLYRSSPPDQNMRIHIATFDSADGDNYNAENCRIASDLFVKQAGVIVRYWCEKGRFRR